MTNINILLLSIIIALFLVCSITIYIYEKALKSYRDRLNKTNNTNHDLIEKLFDIKHEYDIKIEQIKKEYPEYDKSVIRTVRKVESKV